MLQNVTNPEDLVNLEIRNRAISSSKAKNTKHYVAKESGNEVGFVAIDANPNVEYLVLYEVFVPRNLRKKGFGSKLLAEVESMAKNLGYRKVTVNPEPFEQDHPKGQLVEWYKRHGYREMASGAGELEKAVNETNT
jgi:predicted GNAT family acetyltransferase